MDRKSIESIRTHGIASFKTIDDFDDLAELLGDPAYNPFGVSRALEALTYGKAVVIARQGHLILIPTNDDRPRTCVVNADKRSNRDYHRQGVGPGDK